MAELTKDWELYLAGKRYNESLKPNYYDTVDANIAFYNGDQWRNLETEELPKPVFNIIKRVIQFMVASLTTSNVKVHFEPLLYSEITPDPQMLNEKNAAEIANAQVQNLFEKFKMEFKVKDALFDAAIMGDACAHFYFDVNKRPFGGAFSNVKGEICMELVDGTNVFFGNANNPKVDAQPYIIISGRDMVQNLKEEAKRYRQMKQNPDDPENIQQDSDTQFQAGDMAEIEVEADSYGKALYIIVYRKDKKTGRIFASKSVQNAYIYKDIDTGLSVYPVAWMNWEKQKNQYHGRALCTGILPNQIFINRMFAMVMYHLMMTAFPKAVYNDTYITQWTNEIGEAIPVSGLGPEANIKNIAGYLEPGDISPQITNIIDFAMQYTKETLGVSDAALGQVDPYNTSAIIAVQKSSAIPLANPKANLYEWIEDIGRILFDFMGTYYGKRPVTFEKDGKKHVELFDFSVFKDMWMDVRADVGEASYWSELSAMQTLDNLLNQDHIDIIQYLERVPEEYIPMKQKLIGEIEQHMQQAQDSVQAALSHLTPEEQQAFNNAPPELKQQMIARLQSQQPNQQQTPTPPS